MCKASLFSPLKSAAKSKPGRGGSSKKSARRRRRSGTPMPKQQQKPVIIGNQPLSAKSFAAILAVAAARMGMPQKKFTYDNCPIKPKARCVREAPKVKSSVIKKFTQDRSRLDSARACLAVAMERQRKAKEAMKELDGFFATIFRDKVKEAAYKKKLRDAKVAVSFYRAKVKREIKLFKGRSVGTKSFLEECSERCNKAQEALQAAQAELYDDDDDIDDLTTACFSVFGIFTNKVKKIEEEHSRKVALVANAKKAYDSALGELKIAQEEAKSACEDEISSSDSTSSVQLEEESTSKMTARDFRDWPVLVDVLAVVLKSTFPSESDPSKAEVPARAVDDLFTVFATSDHRYLLCSERLTIKRIIRAAKASRRDVRWMEVPKKEMRNLVRIARSRGQFQDFDQSPSPAWKSMLPHAAAPSDDEVFDNVARKLDFSLES